MVPNFPQGTIFEQTQFYTLPENAYIQITAFLASFVFLYLPPPSLKLRLQSNHRNSILTNSILHYLEILPHILQFFLSYGLGEEDFCFFKISLILINQPLAEPFPITHMHQIGMKK